MLGIKWLLFLLAGASFWFARRLWPGCNEENKVRRRFSQFCFFTGIFQLFQGLLYSTKELDPSLYLLIGSYFAFIFAQFALLSFYHWLKALHRFFVYAFFVITLLVIVFSITMPFLEPLDQSIFFRPAYFWGFDGTVFYDFEMGLQYSLDLSLGILVHLLIMPFLLWFCYKTKLGFFSRFTFLHFVMLAFLLHDFGASNNFWNTANLYEVFVVLFQLTFFTYLQKDSGANLLNAEAEKLPAHYSPKQLP
jgi:hypothetical protein